MKSRGGFGGLVLTGALVAAVLAVSGCVTLGRYNPGLRRPPVVHVPRHQPPAVYRPVPRHHPPIYRPAPRHQPRVYHPTPRRQAPARNRRPSRGPCFGDGFCPPPPGYIFRR